MAEQLLPGLSATFPYPKGRATHCKGTSRLLQTLRSGIQFRPMTEQGQCEVDGGWTASTKDAPRVLGAVSAACHGTLNDFLWLTEPDRIDLVGSELDHFYADMFDRQCYWADSGPSTVLAAFSRISNVRRTANTLLDHGRTLLYHLAVHITITSDYQSLCGIICQLFEADVDFHALNEDALTPLAYAARVSADPLHWPPGDWNEANQLTDVARRFESGFNGWLKALGVAGVDLCQYGRTERLMETEHGMQCYIHSNLVEDYAQDFLDQDWYIQLNFVEKHGASGANNPGHVDVVVEVELCSEKRKYSAPGTWPEHETNATHDSSYVSLSAGENNRPKAPFQEVVKDIRRRRNSI